MRTDAKERFGYRLLTHKDRREMTNSYWSYMYGGFVGNRQFVPSAGAEPLHGREKEEFKTEWYRIRNILVNSGYDLSKIRIVRGLK